jgi:hypothetical protein
MVVAANFERQTIPSEEVGAPSAIQPAVFLAVTHCLGETEGYVTSMATALVEGQVAGLEGPLITHWTNDYLNKLDSWDNAFSAIKLITGLSPKSLPGWLSVDAYKEVRNAWVHGQGRLSRRQTRTRVAVERKLGTAGISVAGDEVRVLPDHVRAAALACRAFVTDLDLAVTGRMPSMGPGAE